MSKQLILFQIIFVGLFWVGSSATAYFEDFEDAGNLDGTVYGPTENAPPVVSGGILWTDYVDSGFIANGDYADFSGYMTFNFGGSTDAWKEAVYVIGTDGSNGAPNFAGAISGVLVQYLPDKGWLYILQSWKGGGIWSTVYLEQSGMVNPAGFSNTTDYELHVVDNGDSTLDAWVQEAANPANKGHVYEDIDISGATFYGDKVAVSANFSVGVGGIDDLFIGTSDDFEDGVINTGKWMVSGDGVTESSGTLNVLRGSGYDSSVISNATVLPDVEQTVLLSTSNVDYTSYGSGGAFGFNTAAGDFTKGIMLLQKDDQFEYVYMANGGPAQILKIGNKTYFHGSFEFLWSTDKVVIKKNGLTVFDSYDPVYNGGISWNIPEGPLHAYLRSCLSDAAHGGIYEDVKLELAYTPVANVALHKPYRINQIPIDILDSYMDTQGSQPFTQTHSWYTGELTNGATGSTSSSDYEWVYFSPSGRNSVILDLGAIYNISTVKVTALGNGNYKQVRFPIKIKLYGLVTPGTAMSYEKFCETMETDDQDWTYLGEMVNTFVEDGTSGYVKQTFNTALSGNPQMRLVKLNIYDNLSPTMISEIELLSNDAPQSQGNTPVLVDFPAEGRDAFLPLNIVANEIHAENRTSLAMGSHTGMRDAPFGWRRPLMEMINDDPSYMRSTGTACLNQIGTRALRLYDAWDVNYRSGIEWAKVFNHFNPDHPVVVPSSDDDYVFPYYDEIIDYCAESNYFCVIVLDTWYYDTNLDRVYSTREVANNCPDDPGDPYYTTDPNDLNGILYKAAQRNAATIASYYHQMGYTSGLVLEIGNEGIGRHTNLSPDGPQYAKIVKAFADAIKQVAPEVETAFYEWPSDTEIAGLLTGCNDIVDYMVIHPYFLKPDAVTYMIDDRVEALDAAGLENVDILITEYSNDLWSTISHTYTVGLKQTLMEFAMISHPRVRGLFEHFLFSTAKAMHSDTLYWSIRDNTLDPVNHPVDEHPELMQRFAILPTGMTANLLDKVVKDKIVKYWPGVNSKIAGIMSQEEDIKRILLLNCADNPVELRWTGSFFINKTYKLTSTGENWVHTLQQPWSITETTDGMVPDVIPAKSMLLIELKDLSDLNGSGLVDINDLSMLLDYWLDENCELTDKCDGRDFNNDGTVDLLDFIELANDWLVSGHS